MTKEEWKAQEAEQQQQVAPFVEMEPHSATEIGLNKAFAKCSKRIVTIGNKTKNAQFENEFEVEGWCVSVSAVYEGQDSD